MKKAAIVILLCITSVARSAPFWSVATDWTSTDKTLYTTGQGRIIYVNSTADLGEFYGDAFYPRLDYRAVSETPSTYNGSAVHARTMSGYNDTYAVGTTHCITAHHHIYTSGDANNEYAIFFGDLSADANGRLWGFDLNVHSDYDSTNNLIQGYSGLINRYHSEEPSNGSVGFCIVSYPGKGGGDVAADRSTRTTYPVEYGIAVVGHSGQVGLETEEDCNAGFESAIKVGGYAGGWMDANHFSRFNNGVKIEDYDKSGVYIHSPTTGENPNSITVADNAGDVNLGNNDLIVNHISGSSGTPSIAPGPGAGDGNSVSIAGTDLAGEITITTGTSPAAASVVVTITFSSAYSTAPYIVFSPSNANSVLTYRQLYVTSTTTTFVFSTSTYAMGTSTEYKWMYIVAQ